MPVTVSRYHDFSCGHRVVEHESKCRHLHGHNYRVTFTCSAPGLDKLGRIIDFGVIKSALCMWLEDHWDHKTLLWRKDPIVEALTPPDAKQRLDHRLLEVMAGSIVVVDFNPTAENMALHLLGVVGPAQLAGTEVTLIKVDVEETRKCSASAAL